VVRLLGRGQRRARGVVDLIMIALVIEVALLPVHPMYAVVPGKHGSVLAWASGASGKNSHSPWPTPG
jgi:hypothetical protein